MNKVRLLGVAVFFVSLYLGMYLISAVASFFPGFPIAITMLIALFVGVYLTVEGKFPSDK